MREAYRKKGWALTMSDHIVQCAREGAISSIREQSDEGCNIYGFIEVERSSGNFHFGPSHSYRHAKHHVSDVVNFAHRSFNISHRINELSFGDAFPGVKNPLDGAERTILSSTMLQVRLFWGRGGRRRK